MRRLLLLIILIALGAGAFYYFKREEPITNYPGRGETIVAFGDSLVKGVGASAGNDFVTVLSKKIGQPIKNYGVPGDTTRDGLRRIDEVLSEDPKLVILLLGGNDALRRIPQDETFQNLETIIQKIHASGSMVLLLGVRGGILGDPYEDRFTELAKKYKTAFVANILADVFGRKELMSDSVHPNDAGYAYIVERIYPVLTKLLS
jgi:acyl-CoA thioesterase I